MSLTSSLLNQDLTQGIHVVATAARAKIAAMPAEQEKVVRIDSEQLALMFKATANRRRVARHSRMAQLALAFEDQGFHIFDELRSGRIVYLLTPCPTKNAMEYPALFDTQADIRNAKALAEATPLSFDDLIEDEDGDA